MGPLLALMDSMLNDTIFEVLEDELHGSLQKKHPNSYYQEHEAQTSGDIEKEQEPLVQSGLGDSNGSHVEVTITPELDGGSLEERTQSDQSDTVLSTRLSASLVMAATQTCAVYFLLIGLLVFVWAEHSKSVSITITIVLVIFDYFAIFSMIIGIFSKFLAGTTLLR